ncbi:MAG TPA: site-specific integrase, partial [Phycisphaerales bacterium]|nr:site-specific integrase [Phycisphaerales bacterium]
MRTGGETHADRAEGYTMEEWGAVAKSLDRICADPSAYSYRNRFSERTAKMVRAAAWVAVYGALRISEVVSIKVEGISSGGFTYFINKHRSYPEERSKPFLSPDCWEHVESYLKVRDAAPDDDRLFTTTSATLSRMARAVMLEAGLEPHNGRLGLHGFRHLFASHSLEHDYGGIEGRQHMLGHRSPDTQSIYTREAAKDAAVERAIGPWQEGLSEAAGCTFEWDRTMGEGYYTAMMRQEMPPVPLAAQGPGEVIFDGKAGRLGSPVCFHDHYVMMPLIDDEGETFQWGIVEMRDFKPVRIIVERQSLGWARPDLNCNLTGPVAAFFDGYRAA